MQNELTIMPGLGRALLTSKLAQAGELVGVFAAALAVILLTQPLVDENPFARHGVIFFANIMMLVVIWLGLRLRGQDCGHFGLVFRLGSPRVAIRTVLQSLVVFLISLAAVVLGAVVMAIFLGRPEGADMTGYNYLHGNLPMLLLALAAVYINASFGEEVIYRAFLINRIAELGSGSRTAWILAVLGSSVAFGVVHSAWAVTGMVQMGCMGSALGISYLVVRRNLWVTILAHAYLDTILLVQMYFAGP